MNCCSLKVAIKLFDIKNHIKNSSKYEVMLSLRYVPQHNFDTAVVTWQKMYPVVRVISTSAKWDKIK